MPTREKSKWGTIFIRHPIGSPEITQYGRRGDGGVGNGRDKTVSLNILILDEEIEKGVIFRMRRCHGLPQGSTPVRQCIPAANIPQRTRSHTPTSFTSRALHLSHLRSPPPSPQALLALLSRIYASAMMSTACCMKPGSCARICCLHRQYGHIVCGEEAGAGSRDVEAEFGAGRGGSLRPRAGSGHWRWRWRWIEKSPRVMSVAGAVDPSGAVRWRAWVEGAVEPGRAQPASTVARSTALRGTARVQGYQRERRICRRRQRRLQSTRGALCCSQFKERPRAGDYEASRHWLAAVGPSVEDGGGVVGRWEEELPNWE
ncbi:hypothetical protein FB45DRAFT_866588 [Roridomyces roridus]|uniref:Uncharacterized protein n=1 Tax=Roridomyces roridus TaxID=1738132 RepID=A0AAD7BXK2_9AGAR|nr:hypothetical protein FB45DRAFT_866588 [Roridomyces roridus]